VDAVAELSDRPFELLGGVAADRICYLLVGAQLVGHGLMILKMR
jgi:hypothetical protein